MSTHTVSHPTCTKLSTNAYWPNEMQDVTKLLEEDFAGDEHFCCCFAFALLLKALHIPLVMAQSLGIFVENYPCTTPIPIQGGYGNTSQEP